MHCWAKSKCRLLAANAGVHGAQPVCSGQAYDPSEYNCFSGERPADIIATF